ncbi:MAG: bifunctional metallophosphatase/5'-nucleotidase [Candidatus Amulumruptor caecigallinarius]|nr:bifunctional metallophosphatase/5'-nucleotidase [Candidatus Amulumruptor caecigallinarius]
MRHIKRTIMAASIMGLAIVASAETLTIIHTNDTHSQIDPTSKDLGGILRRQVLIDSIRAEHPGALLVDAGDMVQGTLFFTLYGGRAERDMMNALGYDIQILGNHEFDNGLDSIATIYRGLNADKISTNYDVRGTALQGVLKPYVIRQVGDRKVAFIGINLDPKGMIADKNYKGLKYLDAIKAANSTAWHLKHNEGVDRVVAVTHIGYVADKGITDPELVKASEDIDLVIGGHSHTLIDGKNPAVPPYVANLRGDSILITQNGKSGLWLGEVTLDLDSGHATEKLISVDKRLDDRINPATAKLIEPYRQGVDSLMNVRIGTTAGAFPLEKTGLVNLASDMVMTIGRELTGKPMDLSIMNVGGVRSGWGKGTLTKGQVINTFPFDNRVRVLEIKGRDLQDAFDVMAARGGDGVSANVDAVYDPKTGKCTSITISGKPLDVDATYLLATIDYLANGGDYMSSLTRANTLATSDVVLYDDFIRLISTPPLNGTPLMPDDTRRMHPAY